MSDSGRGRRVPKGWWILALVGVCAVYAWLARPDAPASSDFQKGFRGLPLSRGPLSSGDMRQGLSGAPPGTTFKSFKVVNLNTASLADLETLPGITPEQARAILAGRPYVAMRDLERVGIPRTIIDQLSPPAIIAVESRGASSATFPPDETGRGQRPAGPGIPIPPAAK